MQNGPSWMIVDSNETPGGLASTDVTPEGFVSNFSAQKPNRSLWSSTVLIDVPLALRRWWPCYIFPLQVL